MSGLAAQRAAPRPDRTIAPAERLGLLRRLTQMTHSVDAAEDILQSALLRLEEYRRHTVIGNTVGFLAHAARNIAIDEARKARVRSSVGDAADILENYRDEHPLQDEVLIARERLSRARAVLTQLPERTRTAFMMHRFSKARYSDIAAQLGISVSAVEKHIARASLALANGIDQETPRTGTEGRPRPRVDGVRRGVDRPSSC